MGIGRYFLHDFFTAQEFNRLEEGRRRRARQARQHRRNTQEQVDSLEQDLARVTMLARALADVCLAKGVLTREELGRALLEADLADGTQDGGLSPDVALPGESKPADLDPLDDPA